MCGIYGIASRDAISIEKIVASNDRLSHRGPDGAGLVCFGEQIPGERPPGYDVWQARRVASDFRVALAHRRLAIIDLATGQQPMANADANVWITFNGEIYNYKELRQELERLGYHFHTESDTEVIIAAYEAWGTDCLSKFNGMFAFAIYDLVQQRIFMARDRAGKKPLYYLGTNDRFEFASESKSLAINGEIDVHNLNFYLKLGFLPDDRSIFRGVKKLPLAHAGVFDLHTSRLKVWQYWQLPHSEHVPHVREESLIDELEGLLVDATRIRLRSDVPLGVFLSGGLDSSLIVAAAARVANEPIKTFTVSFPGDESFDESSHARLIASHFQTDHHVLEAPIQSLDHLKTVLSYMDEPLADSSLLPTFMVSKLAREHVTVVLSGEGGDEIFAGCTMYLRALTRISRLDKFPKSVWWMGNAIAKHLPAGVKGRNFLVSMQNGPKDAEVWGTPYFDVHLRSRLLNDSARKELGQSINEPELWKLSRMRNGEDVVDQRIRYDALTYLSDDLLMKVDRSSMMNSLEARLPWLDYRIVEFLFGRVPTDMKIRENTTRWIQKALGKRMLPKEFQFERKQGFCIPLDDWLRTVDEERFRHYLPYEAEIINRSYIDELVYGVKRGRTNASRLFALMLLKPSLASE